MFRIMFVSWYIVLSKHIPLSSERCRSRSIVNFLSNLSESHHDVTSLLQDDDALDMFLVTLQPRFDDAVEQQRHRQQSGHRVHFGLDAQEVTVAECHRHADSVQEAIAGEGFLERLAEHHGEQCCKKDDKCSLPVGTVQ